MSFLNSVLGSIGGNESSNYPQTNFVTPMTQEKPLQDQPKFDRSSKNPPSRPLLANQYREHEGMSFKGRSGSSKCQAEALPSKTDDKIGQSSVLVQKPEQRLPSATNPMMHAKTSKITGSSSVPGRVSADGQSKAISSGTVPVTSAQEIVKKAPKKGSYAEIMSRAKSGQTSSAPVGIIKHKAKEKMSKKRRQELLKGLSEESKSNAKAGSRPGSSDGMSKGLDPAHLAIGKRQDGGSSKKGLQPEYKGTAKARPVPTYKGTKNSTTSVQKPLVKQRQTVGGFNRGSAGSRITSNKPEYQHKQGYSEEEVDEEEDEDDLEHSYESDLSDMEAGFSDVDEEEEIALREAKKDDAAELKRETELKREKEARKKRLALMASKSKSRY